MNQLKKIGAMLLGLVPAVLHYYWTAPLLWSHQSSAAFELNLFLWLVVLGFFLWSCAYEPKRHDDIGCADRDH